MKNLCKFLKTELELPICKMSGKEITDDIYRHFCKKPTFTACPVYQYYLQKYKELTSK